MLEGIAAHVHKDLQKVSEPEARKLFRATEKSLQGIVDAFNQYEQRNQRQYARN